MDFKATFTKNQRRRGFTLVEVMVASAIMGIVMLAIVTLTFFASRSFAAMVNYVDLDQKSRNALDKMTSQIRQANMLTAGNTNSLTFQDSDGGTLVFAWDPSTRKLTRSKNGTYDSKPLLDQCDFLSFSIFQRNPVGGTYDQYPTATPATCKLVQVTWVCSRTILGARVNTESVLSAKIVIRKQ